MCFFNLKALKYVSAVMPYKDKNTPKCGGIINFKLNKSGLANAEIKTKGHNGKRKKHDKGIYKASA